MRKNHRFFLSLLKESGILTQTIRRLQGRCKRRNKTTSSSILLRPQLKAHKSMLKVIENNCESNYSLKQKSIFDRNVARKTNVARWPCCCPERSIKRNAVSRESTRAAIEVHCCFFCCFLRPRLFNQIKPSDERNLRRPEPTSSCNLLKKLNSTSFVCYDYLTVNGSQRGLSVLLFTRLQSVGRDASSKN